MKLRTLRKRLRHENCICDYPLDSEHAVRRGSHHLKTCFWYEPHPINSPCSCNVRTPEALRRIDDRLTEKQRGLVTTLEWPRRNGPHHQSACVMHQKEYECTCADWVVRSLGGEREGRPHSIECFQVRANRWMGNRPDLDRETFPGSGGFGVVRR